MADLSTTLLRHLFPNVSESTIKTVIDTSDGDESRAWDLLSSINQKVGQFNDAESWEIGTDQSEIGTSREISESEDDTDTDRMLDDALTYATTHEIRRGFEDALSRSSEQESEAQVSKQESKGGVDDALDDKDKEIDELKSALKERCSEKPQVVAQTLSRFEHDLKEILPVEEAIRLFRFVIDMAKEFLADLPGRIDIRQKIGDILQIVRQKAQVCLKAIGPKLDVQQEQELKECLESIPDQ